MDMKITDLDIVETTIPGWTPSSVIFSSKIGVATSAFLVVANSQILLNRREIEVLAASLRKWLNEQEE